MTYTNDNETRVATLYEMLSMRRPAYSKSERGWIHRWIDPLGVKQDKAGNRYRLILGNGDAASPVLWSAHTDTVHRQGGAQKLTMVKGNVSAVGSDCLGADNGAGVWLLREMMLAGVPGLYVFHRGEEIGGLGSAWVRDHAPEMLADCKAAIAFDRRGVGSVITHQMCGRTCSDAFAESVAGQLPGAYRPDDGGTFTDTANYEGVIGECTNLSVGYAHEHRPIESLDVRHLLALREAMVHFDASTLVFSRGPGEIDAEDWVNDYTSHYRGAGLRGWSQLDEDEQDWRGHTLRGLVRDNPDEIADWLEEYGVGADELAEAIWRRGGVIRGRH